jgi:hypothetical protein
MQILFLLSFICFNMANLKQKRRRAGPLVMQLAADLENQNRFAILLVRYFPFATELNIRDVSSHCAIYWRRWITKLFKLHWMAWRIFLRSAKPIEASLHNLDPLINTRSSSKKQMEWKRSTNANRTRIRRFTRRHITSLKRIFPKGTPLNLYSYFGDEEDVIDTAVAPEQEAGQFAFGTLDPSAQQQFSFGEDVNMS